MLRCHPVFQTGMTVQFEIPGEIFLPGLGLRLGLGLGLGLDSTLATHGH